MNEIKAYVEEQIQNLIEPDKEQADFLNNIMKYDLEVSKGIINILPEEMLLFITCAYIKNTNFQKTKAYYEEKLQELKLNEKLQGFTETFYLLNESTPEEYTEIKNFFFDAKNMTEANLVKKLFFVSLKIDKKSTKKIVRIFKGIGSEVEDFLLINKIIKFYESLDKQIRTGWTNYLYLYEASKRKPDNIFKNITEEYAKCVENLKKYYEEFIKEYKIENRNYYKRLTIYSELKAKLEYVKEGEYLFIPTNFYTKLPFECLSELILKVNTYNQKLCLELDAENKKMEGIEIDNLFLKYEIKNRLSKEEKEEIMTNVKMDDLDNIMESIAPLLNKITISNRALKTILIATTKEKIENIKKALFLELIDYEFINNNPFILLSPLNDILVKNMEMLKENANKAKRINSILLNPSLEQYIELAKCYKLNIREKIVLENIVKPHFFDTLDVFIEQGFYDDLLRNPEILEYDLVNVIKRIKIAEKLQMNIYESEGKYSKTILDGTNFCVPDELLEQYIFNIVPLKISDTNLKVLNENERLEYENVSNFEELDELTYTIGGIKISKMKVLRNRILLPKVVDLLDCVTYGSILTAEDYNQIATEINARKLKRKINYN